MPLPRTSQRKELAEQIFQFRSTIELTDRSALHTERFADLGIEPTGGITGNRRTNSIVETINGR